MINYKYLFFGYPNYEENFFKRMYRVLRRKYYLKYKFDYVKESLSKRKGFCKKCGCCGTSWISCPYHNYQTGKCNLWDEKDKTKFSKINCGFYWE